MNTKHYLVISGIVGGVIGSALTALLVSPVTAQKDKFDTIQCSRLEVVDAKGVVRVILGSSELDLIPPLDAGQRVIIGVDKDGGRVVTYGKDYRSKAELGIDVLGGNVAVFGKDNGSKAELEVDGNGGRIEVWGRSSSAPTIPLAPIEPFGKDAPIDDRLNRLERTLAEISDYREPLDWSSIGRGGVALRTAGSGGRVEVSSKDWDSRSSFGVDRYGGYVQVKSKGNGMASIGINEFGNGAVSTWDKNGYRQ